MALRPASPRGLLIFHRIPLALVMFIRVCSPKLTMALALPLAGPPALSRNLPGSGSWSRMRVMKKQQQHSSLSGASPSRTLAVKAHQIEPKGIEGQWEGLLLNAGKWVGFMTHADGMSGTHLSYLPCSAEVAPSFSSPLAGLLSTPRSPTTHRFRFKARRR